MNYFDKSIAVSLKSLSRDDKANFPVLNNLYEELSCSLRLKTVLALFTALMFSSFGSLAQIDTAIVRTYGGPYYEEGRQIIECSAGGYAVIGTTGSDQPNNTNFYLLRLDEELNCIWNKNYGGAEVEWGYSIVEDANGNFLICGYTNSFGEGGYDILVYKVDTEGSVIWEKTYGGSDWDFAYKIIAHPIEGYLICGKTYSYGNGGSDAYLLHINDDGNLINEWTYGGEGDDEFVDMSTKSGQSFTAIVGNQSDNSNLDEVHCHVLLLDNDNITILNQVFNEMETVNELGISCSLKEQSLLVATRYYQNQSWDNYNVFELSFSGEILWNASGSYLSPSAIVATPDDGYLMVGTTSQYGLGGSGAMLEKRGSQGVFESAPTFGDVNDELGVSLIINSNQNPILIGNSNSYNQFETYDIYLVQTPSYFINQEYILNLESSSCFTISTSEQINSPSYIYVIGEQLHFKGIENNIPFKVVDMNGRVLLSGLTTSGQPTSMKNLATGVYVVQFDNPAVFPKKLMKL